MSVETKQVKLRLTQDKEVLKTMKRKKSLKNDSQGDKYVVQFDSKSFTFRPGRSITVGQLVANGLRRSSTVIVGDDLTGEVMPILEVVDTYTLGEEDAIDEKRKMVTCPICGLDCKSILRLSRHLGGPAHKRERQGQNVAADTPIPVKPIDWEQEIADAEENFVAEDPHDELDVPLPGEGEEANASTE